MEARRNTVCAVFPRHRRCKARIREVISRANLACVVDQFPGRWKMPICTLTKRLIDPYTVGVIATRKEAREPAVHPKAIGETSLYAHAENYPYACRHPFPDECRLIRSQPFQSRDACAWHRTLDFHQRSLRNRRMGNILLRLKQIRHRRHAGSHALIAHHSKSHGYRRGAFTWRT